MDVRQLGGLCLCNQLLHRLLPRRLMLHPSPPQGSQMILSLLLYYAPPTLHPCERPRRSLNVPPSFAADYVPHSSVAYAVVLTQFALAIPSRSASTNDLHDVFI